jgi:hypothetical protein
MGDNMSAELVVFKTRTQAMMAGFRETRYPHDQDIRAWWPQLGSKVLSARPLDRVTIASRVALKPHERELLRSRLAAGGYWMELGGE